MRDKEVARLLSIIDVDISTYVFNTSSFHLLNLAYQYTNSTEQGFIEAIDRLYINPTSMSIPTNVTKFAGILRDMWDDVKSGRDT
jgi:hypothetical protein